MRDVPHTVESGRSKDLNLPGQLAILASWRKINGLMDEFCGSDIGADNNLLFCNPNRAGFIRQPESGR